MTQHVSNSKNKRFCVRALPVEELATIAEHLDTCSTCLDQFTKTLQSRRGSAPLRFTLAPEFWFRNEHVDYDELVGLADSTLDAIEREVIDLHLKVCGSCKEDVRSFLVLREQIEPETDITYVPFGRELTYQSYWVSLWRVLAWRPVYAAAIVVMGIAIVIGAALLLKRRAENLQARQVPTPQIGPGSTPDSRVASIPSPPATPNETPIEKPNNAEAIIVNDRGGTVTVGKSGSVAGLDDVPAPIRDEIAQVLLSERLDRPAILNELGSHESNLRGSKTAQPFKLIFPSRTVIVPDRPGLKWEKASGASSYRVYINDSAGNEVARSEELPSERTEWMSPLSLKRAEIYTWTVVALVDGKEIVSPGPSSPEVKFQVLSLSNLQQLNQLKKTRSHLALGIFYTKVGMVLEAEHEFQELSRLNPNGKVSDKLLRRVRALRRGLN